MAANERRGDRQLLSTTEDLFSRVPMDTRWPPEGGEADPQQYRWLGGDHSLARQQSALALPGDPASIAVIDWCAARNVMTLFEEAQSIVDPFVAILDLATVIGALVFYDGLLLLDYAGIAARLAEVFGLKGVVHGIDATEQSPDNRMPGMSDLIEKYFIEAQMELEAATDANQPWVNWLRESWAQLLPSTEFPRHDYEALDRLHGHYDAYNVGGRTHPAFDALFQLQAGSYRPRDVDFGKLILDNDARSLFYEILVEQLRIHLDRQRILTFRYLANPLRMPMQAARARLAEAELRAVRPAAEDWLQAQWAGLQLPLQTRPLTLRMPFWLGVVLSTARTRQEVPAAVRALRDKARRFRARRREIEEDLFAGDLRSIEAMQAALQGDVSRLTETAATVASTALDIADITTKMVLPLPIGPKSAAALVAPVSANWFRQQWLRLFRPQLWLMYDLGKQAQRVTRVLPITFERFELPRAFAAQPTEFIERIGRIAMPM
jgi:hypothetical protein